MRGVLIPLTLVGLLATPVIAQQQIVGFFAEEQGGFFGEIDAGLRDRLPGLGDRPVDEQTNFFAAGSHAADYASNRPEITVLVTAVKDSAAVVQSLRDSNMGALKTVLADESSAIDGAATVGTNQTIAGGLIGSFACDRYPSGKVLPLGTRSNAETIARLQGLQAEIEADGCELEMSDVVWLEPPPLAVEVPAETRAIVALDWAAQQRARTEATRIGFDGPDVLCVLCGPSIAIDDPADPDDFGVLAMTIDDPRRIGSVAADMAHAYALGTTQSLNALVPPLFVTRDFATVGGPIEGIDFGVADPPSFQCYGTDLCESFPATRCHLNADEGGGQDGGGLCPPVEADDN